MKKKNTPTVAAVILAAGCGSRMNTNKTKQTMELLGHTVIWHTVKAFFECESVDSIVLVGREEELGFLESELAMFSKKISAIVKGGDTRRESAEIGFLSVGEEYNFVAIHDGARCLITKEGIDAVIAKAREYGCATAASAVTDTIKAVGADGRILSTLDRSTLMRATTPQIFRRDIYAGALSLAEIFSATDDNMLVEAYGAPVYCVDIGDENIKITTMSDYYFAEKILEKRMEK